jgi:hypothetical protein
MFIKGTRFKESTTNGGRYMATKMMSEKIGVYAFLLGILIAVIVGLLQGAGVISTTQLGYVPPLVLVVLGIVVGFLNISDKEIPNFLIAVIALGVAGLFSAGFTPLNTLVAPLGTMISLAIGYIGVMVAPAALIVAIKSLWDMSSS